jgi:hypothetical protein
VNCKFASAFVHQRELIGTDIEGRNRFSVASEPARNCPYAAPDVSAMHVRENSDVAQEAFGSGAIDAVEQKQSLMACISSL